MNSILVDVIKETLEITFFILIMMAAVDIINVWTRGKISLLLKGKSKFRQYTVASFIGAIPGCWGGFTNVTLYIHGLISFGALAGSMAAASGDEAFVMLTLFPGTALFLFFILFVVSIVGGRLIDVIVKKFNIATKSDCHELVVHSSEKTFKHFFREHVFGHIIKKHLWKIAIWTFGALLFAEGLIRFSILLTSSVVQDGHGMLPLLSYSVEDSVKIKAFNFSFGIILGLIVFVFGY